MRLLHTSDWHLGRTFHRRNVLGDQESVLLALVDLVVEHAVDVVLIAGDLYDRPVPSVDATQLASRIFGRIRRAGAEIVLSTGNHDSAPRLGAFADLLAPGGLHIRHSTDQLAEPVLFGDAFGDVAIYGVPYLEPDVARQVLGVPQVRGHAGVLGEAMRRIHADLATRPAGTRSVVLSHSFVIGGRGTDSERCIDTAERSPESPGHCDPLFDFKRGTVGSVPADTFDGIDYVALGHLHRRQQLGRHLRYSGSPLPYSFSEAGQTKGCWLIDLDAKGLGAVRPLDLPVARPLATVRGELAEILLGHHDLREHYLAFELTDQQRPVDAMRRLLECFPYAVTMDWRPPAGDGTATERPISRQGLPDIDLIGAFLTDCRGSGLTASERGLVGQALTDIRVTEAAA